MTNDALTIILTTLRNSIQATGVPPDALQDALHDAERRLRASLGGGHHHISRVPSTKARIAELAEQQRLTSGQIAERLGITQQYVCRVTRLLNVRPPQGAKRGE